MTSGGFIKLHREMLDKAIWRESTAEQKVILVTLLMMANHAENEWEWGGEKFKAKPGQFVTSEASIVEKCGNGVKRQSVRTALKKFEKYEFLTREATKRNSLITIINWEKYQGSKRKTNQRANQELTKSQPTANQELTTNKNDKNDKNIKREGGKPPASPKFIIPSIDEIEAYCRKRGNDVDAERFWNFYNSKGWYVGKNKMKSWKSAVITWEKRNGHDSGEHYEEF